jgi:hypothetical protein
MVALKNVVFWDIKNQLVPHRGHTTSLLPSPVGYCYVRFEVFTAVTMKNSILWDKNPVPTSQRTHYLSATEPSQLMLCKIRGFHGGNYEECRLLGYKNPVRTSQETHYVSTT